MELGRKIFYTREALALILPLLARQAVVSLLATGFKPGYRAPETAPAYTSCALNTAAFPLKFRNFQVACGIVKGN